MGHHYLPGAMKSKRVLGFKTPPPSIATNIFHLHMICIKKKLVSKQSWENAGNGLIQVFMYSKIIFFKLPVEYIISELKVKLHSSF